MLASSAIMWRGKSRAISNAPRTCMPSIFGSLNTDTNRFQSVYKY